MGLHDLCSRDCHGGCEVAQLLHPAVGERAVRLRKSFACLRPVFCSSKIRVTALDDLDDFLKTSLSFVMKLYTQKSIP